MFVIAAPKAYTNPTRDPIRMAPLHSWPWCQRLRSMIRGEITPGSNHFSTPGPQSQMGRGGVAKSLAKPRSGRRVWSRRPRRAIDGGSNRRFTGHLLLNGERAPIRNTYLTLRNHRWRNFPKQLAGKRHKSGGNCPSLISDQYSFWCGISRGIWNF